MRKRIFGLERETAFYPHEAYTMSESPVRNKVELLRPHTRNGVSIYPAGSEFIIHGGRAYWDTGDHFEMSTPECSTARDLVIWDKAGERILEDIARVLSTSGSSASRLRAKLARFGGCTFLKNNVGVDTQRSALEDVGYASSKTYISWGSHLNLLLNIREAKYADARRILGPFLFSSSWLTGSGLVWVTDDGRFVYLLSQRAPFITKFEDGCSTTLKKPMFLWRDRPLADEKQYYRIHIIGLDSAMCEWQTYVPAVILGILLRMIEDGVLDVSHYCSDPTDFSELFTMKHTTMQWGKERDQFCFQGETHTAASLHRKYYLEPILAYKASGVAWSNEEEDGLRKYEFLLGLFEQARSSEELAEAFAPFEDWAAKLHYIILPDMRRHGYSFENRPDNLVQISAGKGKTKEVNVWSRLRVFDNFYHDVRRDRGLYYQLVKAGLVERLVSEEEIMFAKEHPPSGNRAEGRDKRICELRLRNETRLETVYWTFLGYAENISAEENKIREMNDDPFSPDPAAFSRNARVVS